jgi:predicted lipoprotein
VISAHRRSFLLGLALAPLGWACRRAITREEALRATLQRVLLPDARAIGQTSLQLEAALLQLSAAADAAALERARQAFRAALLAWQRSFAFQHGPFMTSGALLRACYWPARKHSIANLVLSGGTLDAARVTLLGVDEKGLFNIEQLLFEPESEGDTTPWVLGPHGEPARALARAFAADVKAQAQTALVQLGDGAAFTDEFARAGQMSLNRLLDKLLGTVEASTTRIERVLIAHTDHKLRASDVQAAPSGLSSELLKTWLAVAERCYGRAQEPSLAALAQAVAPAIHSHTSAALAQASAAVAPLGPLERLVERQAPQLAAAVTALKSLEVSMRTELASALGVTISFNSSDGD